MKLHTVFISYNRVDLTQQAVESFQAMVTVPYSFVIVDNGSTDGAAEWLAENFSAEEHILLNENRYPGYACNTGFGVAPDDATHFHRADNDFVFLPGFCNEIRRGFEKFTRLGQLGLRTDEEERYAGSNVGGNCVIPREIWEEGLRWDERPWPQIRDEVGIGWTEDSLMSISVARMGWQWRRVGRPCIRPNSHESPEDPYYQGTWADRGLGPKGELL